MQCAIHTAVRARCHFAPREYNTYRQKNATLLGNQMVRKVNEGLLTCGGCFGAAGAIGSRFPSGAGAPRQTWTTASSATPALDTTAPFAVTQAATQKITVTPAVR